MEIEKALIKVKCDFYGCKNMADFSFKTRKVFQKELHFCRSCLNDLYSAIGKNIVPKAAETPFKKKSKN